jgi:hypothetical protein
MTLNTAVGCVVVLRYELKQVVCALLSEWMYPFSCCPFSCNAQQKFCFGCSTNIYFRFIQMKYTHISSF